MKIIIGIIIVALVAIGGIALINKDGSGDTNVNTDVNVNSTTTTAISTTTASTATTTSSTATTTKSYTMAEVSSHNTASSCWAVVSAKVYDLTNWISKHPGGEQAIMSICGKDGTAQFTTQHSKDEKPQDVIKMFYIGELAV